MKLSILILLFLHHTSLNDMINGTPNFESESYGKWKMSMNEAGIKIYSRWVEVNQELKVRQLKGEMDCNKSATVVTKLITDENAASKWLSRAIEHEKIQDINKNEWITYTLFNLPWPFNNQDLVAKNTVTMYTDSMVIKIEGIPDMMPEKKGISRIQHFEGIWKVYSSGNDKSKVEYTVITKSKPIAPRWIVDSIIEKNFWTTMNNLQKMAN